ncbi:MAG: hypothetical protein ACJAW2_000528 [Shewanella sp.]|jgi:hypothetical protein|tara:strand:- start:1679 stop:1780 length:102 start_codon:yes stop_codon:yes gene_type:complete
MAAERSFVYGVFDLVLAIVGRFIDKENDMIKAG